MKFQNTCKEVYLEFYKLKFVTQKEGWVQEFSSCINLINLIKY